MRASVYSSGFILTFDHTQKHILENGGSMACAFHERDFYLLVNVVDKVEASENNFLCEPGFRITDHTIKGNPQPFLYEIWMDERITTKLIETEYACTRSAYDRVDMRYWDLS